MGLAGVEGNGQSELVEALTGLRHAETGHIRIGGHDLTNASPRRFVERGVAHIPADRHKYGLVLEQSIADNLVLSTYYQPPFAKGLRRVFSEVWDNAVRLVKAFDVRTPSPALLAGALSGGNQQKAVVAREMNRPAGLLIAAQPTRGLDIGSIEFIHKKLIAARDQGMAVLLVSAELDEILSLSDRIAVIFKGRIAAVVDGPTAKAADLGLLMAGARPEG